MLLFKRCWSLLLSSKRPRNYSGWPVVCVASCLFQSLADCGVLKIGGGGGGRPATHPPKSTQKFPLLLRLRKGYVNGIIPPPEPFRPRKLVADMKKETEGKAVNLYA